MRNILLLFLVALSSCKMVNIAKKSDATCTACYGYLLDNCPTFAKKDSVYIDRVITIPGITITGVGNASQPCEMLIDNKAKGDTLDKPDVLISSTKDTKTGIWVNTTMNTGTGKVNTDLKIPPQIIEEKFKAPCNCLFTDHDFKNYIKAKVDRWWHSLRWWIIGVLIATILGFIFYLKINNAHSNHQ